MALSSRLKNKLLDAINNAFADIGTEAGTRPPRSKENTAPTAWEYFVSFHLAGLAKGRLDAAKKACIKAGILFDHERHPRMPGDNGLIFTGEQVGVFVTVKNSGTRLDTDKLYAILMAKGVSEDVLSEAYEEASYKTRPAHEFRPSLVVNDNANGK